MNFRAQQSACHCPFNTLAIVFEGGLCMEHVAANAVFEKILAGQPAGDVALLLRSLSAEDRQNVLCTTCAMRDELGRNCVATGREAIALLTQECPFFCNDVPTCLIR
jgi:hypothetical protein